MSSSKPKKLQVGTSRSRKLSATPNTSNALSIAASSAASSTVTPTTSKSKRTRKSPDYFGFESSVYSVSNPKPMTAPKSQKQINPVIETVIHDEALQPSVIDTSCELTVVSPPEPQPVGTWSPEEYDFGDYKREVSMSIFHAENQIKKRLIDLSVNSNLFQLIFNFIS